jgi:radical SAM protein with 4Fe4S-binding SPASM domain
MRATLFDRVVVPSRLGLIYRQGETLGYNPGLNIWHRLDESCAETLRWLRAGRDRDGLAGHLTQRFGYTPEAAWARLQTITQWCVVRRLLYLDHEPAIPELLHAAHPLATVYWICTQACNLRCTYCYQEATVARPQELSTVEAKTLIDQVVEVGARTLVFTGGEPFTRRDLFDIARYAKGCALRTTVITNGHYITPKNVPDVAAIFDLVTISLDHGRPEHHDRQRGAGSWERALRGIDLLLKAGVRVDMNSVLSRFGLRDVKDLFRLVRTRQLGQHRIMPQFPMGRGACARDDELTPTDLLHLPEHLHAIQQEVEDERAGMKIEGAYSQKGLRRNHCGAGLSEVSVDPEGWVYPCKLLQYPQFRTQNIREARLGEIFRRDPLLRRLQGTSVETLHPCKTCIIKNHCGGGCRGIHVSFTQNYMQAHPLFCAYLRRAFEGQAWGSTGDVPAHRTTRFIDAPGLQSQLIPLTEVAIKS